jgi:hypothetical protein
LDDDCDIDDPLKIIHSLRHRAEDQLRASGCQRDMQQWLLGHDEKTVSDDYGKASSAVARSSISGAIEGRPIVE